MAAFNFGPDPLQGTFFIPGTNTPGAGVQLFLYAAGSTAKQIAYTDSAGVGVWANPIVLDAGGNLPGGNGIWFPAGKTYKAVWAPANDTDPPSSPYRTLDNLAGMNDGLGTTNITTVVNSGGGSEWVSTGTPTFINATSFSLVGSHTAAGDADPGRRFKGVGSTTVYGYINSATTSAGSTTVNITGDTVGIDASLSTMAFGLLTAKNPSVPYGISYGSEVVVSAAKTTNIFSVPVQNIQLVGTTTINYFDIGSPGQIRNVRVGVVSTQGLSIVQAPQTALTSITLPVQFFDPFISTRVTSFSFPLNGGDTFSVISLGSSGSVITQYSKPSGYSLIFSKTVSNSSEINFLESEIDWQAYQYYDFFFDAFKPGPGLLTYPLKMQVSSVGTGTPWVSSGNSYANATQFIPGTGSTTRFVTGNTSFIALTDLVTGSNNIVFFMGDLRVYGGPSNSGLSCLIRSFYEDNTAQWSGVGGALGPSGWKSIRFFYEGNTIGTGTVRVYGARKFQ